jgi:hypothetical protein
MTEMAWQSSFFDVANGYSVAPILPKDADYLIMNVHYAKRRPSISYAFGLFSDSKLVGVCTYGAPASASLVKGIAGDKWIENVIELNRLCLVNNQPNEASRLVGASLKMLPKPSIVVSYADTAQDHDGIIYQATNFLYTGTTAPHKDWAIKGLTNTHSRSLGHLFGGNATLDQIKDYFGDDFHYVERSIKHRYIKVIASKTDKKLIMRDLRYPVLPYPKKGKPNG